MASVSSLIVARQRELYSRVTSLQNVCREDEGSIVEDVALESMIEELDFLTDLAHSWLSELQERAAVESLLEWSGLHRAPQAPTSNVRMPEVRQALFAATVAPAAPSCSARHCT